jgi:predicted DNA-binding protein
MVKVSKEDVRGRVRRTLAQRKRKPVQVEFPEPLYARLEAVAAKMNATKSDIVREATESALDALEGK